MQEGGWCWLLQGSDDNWIGLALEGLDLLMAIVRVSFFSINLYFHRFKINVIGLVQSYIKLVTLILGRREYFETEEVEHHNQISEVNCDPKQNVASNYYDSISVSAGAGMGTFKDLFRFVSCLN